MRKKRPPLPEVVHVAWFWDGTGWAIDFADTESKALRHIVRLGFSGRHLYAEYRLVTKRRRARR